MVTASRANDSFPNGLYELLQTRFMNEHETRPGQIAHYESVGEAETPEVLARHIAQIARRSFANLDVAAQLALANDVLALLNPDALLPASDPRQMLELSAATIPPLRLVRPSTALSESALLTNARDEPSLGSELRAELASADEVDLLCAFVRWNGIRVLEPALIELRERGVPFRVITTTYVGATERRALDELVTRFGAIVQVNYETQATRLHAKAWLFRRNSGFNTAYIGSSNLSHSALVDGLEWNVRLSQVTTPALIHKFDATFETYWNDPSFEDYDPTRDGARLHAVLNRGQNYGTSAPTLNLSGLELRARPYQAAMLEALTAEREVHDRHRNLIVAATGTGKTVVAALDYRNLALVPGPKPRLLFVAHRKEILEQSMRVYREAMMDGSFGELFIDGAVPNRWNQVFASVQSLISHGLANIDPAHFDIVVIDEFHHAEARTYRRLLDHFAPQELLGLTATPERSDGVNVASFFGGRVAAELRLWDALSADILVPFHYFGVADDVDLTAIEWKRGGYDLAALDTVYTGNDARAAKVLRELADKVTDVHAMRAIGFCVSVAHADYMAKVFTKAGIAAVSISGTTSSSGRIAALTELRNGTINCIFAVDLFNEGLDIPHIDTILLLRPTQSATIFLQQLGRGLRRAPGKAVLTVLDFIGQQRREFRFDLRYRALTGAGRASLVKQVESGFPYLPSGSQLILDRVSQRIVLENIRTQLSPSRRALVADIREHAAGFADFLLADYLRVSGRGLADVYRRGSWTALAREAAVVADPLTADDAEPLLLKRMSSLLHVDDAERAAAYARLSAAGCPNYADLPAREQCFARMLVLLVWSDGGGFDSYQEALESIRLFPAVSHEIAQLVAIAADAARRLPRSLSGRLANVPIFSHARYARFEVLAALGHPDFDKRVKLHREGVAWCAETKTDALFVTLHKSEKRFSPTVMYRDYALSDELFHWESQNATTTSSPVGLRYLNSKTQGTNVVLFSRHSSKDDDGFTGVFTCLGEVRHEKHTGEKPVAINWRLDRSMPGEVFASASAVAQ
ncbi:MAG: DUF3427 domain-containing protein [Microbacteriaceae bacterium]|nr:DUF3427 domain-containing protein [Microbacteriaceae bacterium]